MSFEHLSCAGRLCAKQEGKEEEEEEEEEEEKKKKKKKKKERRRPGAYCRSSYM